jgi:hypothetical protein
LIFLSAEVGVGIVLDGGGDEFFGFREITEVGFARFFFPADPPMDVEGSEVGEVAISMLPEGFFRRASREVLHRRFFTSHHGDGFIAAMEPVEGDAGIVVEREFIGFCFEFLENALEADLVVSGRIAIKPSHDYFDRFHLAFAFFFESVAISETAHAEWNEEEGEKLAHLES